MGDIRPLECMRLFTKQKLNLKTVYIQLLTVNLFKTILKFHAFIFHKKGSVDEVKAVYSVDLLIPSCTDL